jgi:hypothetical protein
MSDDWAGLLASGSNYSLHLPAAGLEGKTDIGLPAKLPAVAFAEFVPGYSGGTATDSHRLPYSSPRRQAGGDTQVFVRTRPRRIRTPPSYHRPPGLQLISRAILRSPWEICGGRVFHPRIFQIDKISNPASPVENRRKSVQAVDNNIGVLLRSL